MSLGGGLRPGTAWTFGLVASGAPGLGPELEHAFLGATAADACAQAGAEPSGVELAGEQLRDLFANQCLSGGRAAGIKPLAKSAWT